jgi:hypothetical protein
MSPTKKRISTVSSTPWCYHNGSGFYCCHRSSGAQTKGACLIYGLLVMPPALGLVELFWGEQVVSAWRHDAVLRHCLCLHRHCGWRSSMPCPVHPVGPPMNFGRRHRWATDDAGGQTRQLRATSPRCCRHPLLQCWRTFKSQDRQKCTSTFFQATATTSTNSSKISRDRPKCTSTFWIKSETFR